ncbi:MAG: response regulator [Betaproteobacteria bacterium]|nr:response regulator [Betaproteobacteria bacterium]MDH3437604.1 response regulator [Betaproteobacteria bacterium]
MSARILIVDDEEIVVKSCLRILADTDYDVDVARGGLEALKKIDDTPYDVLVVDIMMPQIGGLEVLKHVKHTRPDSEVIICTGLSQTETALRARELDAFGYLPKPFEPDEILQLIAQALARRRRREEPPAL